MPLITAPPDLSHTLTPPAARHPDRKIKTPLPRLQNPQFFSLSPFSRQEYRAYQTPGLILLPKLTSTSTHQPTKRQETPPSSLHSTHRHRRHHLRVSIRHTYIHTLLPLPLPTQTNRRQHLQVSIRHTRQTRLFFFFIYKQYFFFLLRESPTTTTPQLGGNNNSPAGGQQQQLPNRARQPPPTRALRERLLPSFSGTRPSTRTAWFEEPSTRTIAAAWLAALSLTRVGHHQHVLRRRTRASALR